MLMLRDFLTKLGTNNKLNLSESGTSFLKYLSEASDSSVGVIAKTLQLAR